MKPGDRIPIVRKDRDGTIIDGTALVAMNTLGLERPDGTHEGTFSISDFRDLDGRKLDLPGGSRFEIDLDYGD